MSNPNDSDAVTSTAFSVAGKPGGFSYEMLNSVPVVVTPEEIDMTNAPELRSVLLAAATHGGGTLVVDMTHTRFCDSSGLYALVEAHRRARASAGELRLAVSTAAVLRILALTGADRVVLHFPSLEQALLHETAIEVARAGG